MIKKVLLLGLIIGVLTMAAPRPAVWAGDAKTIETTVTEMDFLSRSDGIWIRTPDGEYFIFTQDENSGKLMESLKDAYLNKKKVVLTYGNHPDDDIAVTAVKVVK